MRFEVQLGEEKLKIKAKATSNFNVPLVSVVPQLGRTTHNERSLILFIRLEVFFKIVVKVCQANNEMSLFKKGLSLYWQI